MTSNKISQYNTLILFNLVELQLLLPFVYDNFESLMQNFSHIWTGSKFGNFWLGDGKS